MRLKKINDDFYLFFFFLALQKECISRLFRPNPPWSSSTRGPGFPPVLQEKMASWSRLLVPRGGPNRSWRPSHASPNSTPLLNRKCSLQAATDISGPTCPTPRMMYSRKTTKSQTGITSSLSACAARRTAHVSRTQASLRKTLKMGLAGWL